MLLDHGYSDPEDLISIVMFLSAGTSPGIGEVWGADDNTSLPSSLGMSGMSKPGQWRDLLGEK